MNYRQPNYNLIITEMKMSNINSSQLAASTGKAQPKREIGSPLSGSQMTCFESREEQLAKELRLAVCEAIDEN